MKKITLLLLITISYCQGFDLSKFRQYRKATVKSESIIKNGSFVDGLAHWHIHKKNKPITVGQQYGMNGSPGMKYTRTDINSYTLISQSFTPKAGVKYKFGGWIKGTGALCVEVYKKGKYQYGVYGAKSRAKNRWVNVQSNFITHGENPRKNKYTLTFYVQKSTLGTTYFDDFYLMPDVADWLVDMVWPTHRSVTSDSGEIHLSNNFVGQYISRKNGTQPKLSLLLQAMKNKKILKETVVPLSVNPIAADLGSGLPIGKIELKVTLLDIPAKEIYGEKVLKLTVLKPEKAPSYACTVDAKGRMVVNGKLFMPIGLYGGAFNENDMKLLKDSKAFNCVMPYLQNYVKDRYEVETKLDLYHKYDLKLLFNMIQPLEGRIGEERVKNRSRKERDAFIKMIVKHFKKHPAILVWYVADEIPISKIKWLEHNRALINSLDRWHPTWAVYYQTQDFPYYLPAQDIISNDPYPINTRAQKSTLTGVNSSTADMNQLGAPCWSVPQIFTKGCYSKEAKNNLKVFLTKYRYPTEHEMLAISVTEAINGSKGFIMYSYGDLKRGPDPDQFKNRWPQVCRVAQKLKTLKSFILSDIDGPKIKIKNIQGKINARCFADGKGNFRLLISGLTHISKAEITVPAGVKILKSTTGKTQYSDKGKYIYTSKGISCDILTNEY